MYIVFQVVDEAWRQRLVEEHLSLVRQIARKIAPTMSAHFDLDELIAFGNRGLVEAANRYDPERNTTFRTYAHYRIRGAIYDELRAMSHLPRRLYHQLRAAQHTDEYLESLAEEETAARQIGAAPTASPPPTRADGLQSLAEMIGVASTIACISLEAAQRRGFEPLDDSASPEETAALEQNREALRRALDQLPDKDRSLVDEHYFAERTLADIGRSLAVDRSWASRMHQRAIKRLYQLMTGATAVAE